MSNEPYLEQRNYETGLKRADHAAVASAQRRLNEMQKDCEARTKAREAHTKIPVMISLPLETAAQQRARVAAEKAADEISRQKRAQELEAAVNIGVTIITGAFVAIAYALKGLYAATCWTGRMAAKGLDAGLTYLERRQAASREAKAWATTRSNEAIVTIKSVKDLPPTMPQSPERGDTLKRQQPLTPCYKFAMSDAATNDAAQQYSAALKCITNEKKLTL